MVSFLDGIKQKAKDIFTGTAGGIAGGSTLATIWAVALAEPTPFGEIGAGIYTLVTGLATAGGLIGGSVGALYPRGVEAPDPLGWAKEKIVDPVLDKIPSGEDVKNFVFDALPKFEMPEFNINIPEFEIPQLPQIPQIPQIIKIPSGEDEDMKKYLPLILAGGGGVAALALVTAK